MKKFRPKYNEYIAFLKTDILPFETSISYNNDKLYEWIVENKEYFRKEKNRKSKPTAPYAFNSYVRLHKYRKISLINPYSYLDILQYVEQYERIFIKKFKESPYSIRYAIKMMDNYQYTQKIRSKYYVSEKIDKLEKKNGSYYKISPYKRNYEFENSNFFQKKIQQYPTFAKVDIKSCFDSIYTHSYKWLISSNVRDSKALNRLNIYRATDELNQRLNARKSNGILVGPEFMRLQAEILLCEMDKRIDNVLVFHKIDKKIYRFIDDYYIFSNSNEEAQIIIKAIRDELNEFQLHLNESKTHIYDDYFDLNDWYNDINYIMETFDINKFYTPKIRKVLHKLYINHKTKRSTVMSFILSVCSNNFFNLILEFHKIEKLSIEEMPCDIKNRFGKQDEHGKYNKEQILKNYINKNLSERRIFKVIDELIYYVSLEPKYINSLKLIHLIIEILVVEELVCKYVKNMYYKNVITNVITKNREALLSCKTNDNINILLIFEYLNIELTEKEVSAFVKEDNLLMLAQLKRYADNTKNHFSSIDLFIIKKISEFNNKLLELNSLQELYEDEIIWVFILFPSLVQNDKSVSEIIKRDDNLITKYLTENNEFFETSPITNIEELKILNTRIYFKSLININY